jgi:hypothetical protein
VSNALQRLQSAPTNYGWLQPYRIAGGPAAPRHRKARGDHPGMDNPFDKPTRSNCTCAITVDTKSGRTT